MQNGQPSRTALGAARARAFHQTADQPLIFADPMAASVADAADKIAGAADGDGIPSEARLFLAMRHRFAEDAFAQRASEYRQVVVLGAGLDTFGLRNSGAQLRVFEVDHPATQQWKRQLLTDARIAVPSELRFVPVDFETETLAEGLAAAGFDENVPTFFVWLGVLVYLTPGGVRSTLEFIARHRASAQVVIDYSEPISALPERNQPIVAALSRVMTELGEPWLSLFTAPEFAVLLKELGFDEIEDLDWSAMIERFAPDNPAEDLVGGHVLRAGHTGR
ncbi:SAM-dependent methyltransferase [Nocardia sp. NPDC052001]|uniref:class I SAM-dependent methyltransferase n=1 Tax=Nocardia sp. NPDC052001 TaxID=3154853 RepID=UPI00342228E6